MTGRLALDPDASPLRDVELIVPWEVLDNAGTYTVTLQDDAGSPARAFEFELRD